MSSLQGNIDISYKNLVNIFGEPSDGDEHKTDAEWEIVGPNNKIYIYNYKDGKNYCGSEGLEVEQIRDWYIRGEDPMDAEYIRNIIATMHHLLEKEES